MSRQKPPPQEQGYLRKPDAAEYLGISIRTLSEWMRRKDRSSLQDSRMLSIQSLRLGQGFRTIQSKRH